jgi:hypothetical protein
MLMVGIGCSSESTKPKAIPASGKVVYRKKQIPVGALVVFHPKDSKLEDAIKGKPFGTVKEDGTFTLTTYAENDGAPPGEYGVTIEWKPRQEGKMSLSSEGGGSGIDKLGGRYGNPQQPVLTATVKENDANSFNFEVD